MISDSGPGSSGETFDRAWELNREAGVELVDEHYYNAPSWFLENNERYDAYDREARRSSSANTPPGTTASPTRSPRPRS